MSSGGSVKIGLVVGLGNPGKRYGGTRHNAGFAVLDRVLDVCGVGDVWSEKGDGDHSRITVGGREVNLLKPTTMMNNSGVAVGRACRYSGVLPHEVLVVHDDIDILLGDVRVKEGGGDGGHNGLKSIDCAIGKGYRRLRCGVGRPLGRGEGDVARYVLSRFSRDELRIWEEELEKIAKSFSLFMGDLLEAKKVWGRVREGSF